jgi:hypothetical protein
MPADVLDLLRRSDPARGLEPFAGREALLGSIVSTRPERAPRPRRGLLVAFALLAAVACLAGGWTVYRAVFGPTANDVRRDFAVVTRDIPLPPGVAWTDPDLDEQGIYPGPAALMMALFQATCAWTSDWNAAYAAGDTARMRADAEGFAEVRRRMPLHRGTLEDTGGFDAASLAAFDAMLADMRAGRPGSVRQELRANC